MDKDEYWQLSLNQQLEFARRLEYRGQLLAWWIEHHDALADWFTWARGEGWDMSK
jgi:hypothetical protein